MRKGRVEQAKALALRIGSEIIAVNSGHMKAETKSVGTRDMWSAVRDITGKRRSTTTFSCVDAKSLNTHYAKVFTDRSYHQPPLKQACRCPTDWRSKMLVSKQFFFLIRDDLLVVRSAYATMPFVSVMCFVNCDLDIEA